MTRNPKSKPPRQASKIRPGTPEPHLSFPVVGIGASAGGLEALKAFLSAVPADTGMAFIIIQHLGPEQKSHLAELLAKQTAMRVIEAEQGLPVEPDCVYTIPPGAFLTLREGRLHLEKPALGRAVRMSIDLLFRSLAEGLREAAVGIVLSGTGSDGTLGVRAIRGAGGLVLAQDPASAEFDAMPQSAIATGLVDYVLPPAEMAGALLSYVRRARTQGEEVGSAGEEDAEQALRDILALLLRQAKSDFSGYKRGTLLRRIQRRMSIVQVATPADYLQHLRADSREVSRLAKDMLIGVTGFFRDKEAFAGLRKKVIAPLVQAKEEGAAVRVWVPGCATGEEAYSIAMLLFEEMADAGGRAPVQVFASDIDEETLGFARSGVYPASIAEDVPADLLERFFVKVDGGYRITQQLREAVIFTTQNLLTAPPFSNLDLISCRNVLIYFGAEAQDKVLSLFAFALSEGGYLFLGKSDSILGHTEFFRAIARTGRLYQRSGVPHHALGRFEVEFGTTSAMSVREQMTHGQQQALLSLPPQILLDHFGASLVLIDTGGGIVSFYGESERYLVHPTGRADLNLFSMARPRLSGRLRVGVRQAAARNAAVHLARIPLVAEGGARHVDVTITPYLPAGGTDPLLAVIFQEAPEAEAASAPAAGEAVDSVALVEQLEAELRASRAEMLAATAEFEASDEQLRAIHEEAVSVNEELQSTNEELEASKEELQSLNEELTTVNSQLGEKMEELAATNNDLLNLFGATEIATIFLDKELLIRRFTPAAEGLLNLIASDIGRPVHHLSQNFTGADLASSAEVVLKNLSVVEQEVVGRYGRWYTLRVFPYRTADDRIDGVVVTLADVTRLKLIEESLKAARAYAESIITTVREPLVVLDADLRVVSANLSFHRMLEAAPEETIGQPFYELRGRQWDLPALRRLLDDIIPNNGQLDGFEVECQSPTAGSRTLLLNARRIEPEGPRPPLVLLAIEDVTDQRQREQQQQRLLDAEHARAETARLLEVILDNARPLMVYLDRDLRFARVNQAYAEFVGMSPKELFGRTKFEVWQDPKGLAALQHVRDSGEPWEAHEQPLRDPRRPEEEIRYTDYSIVPIKDKHGVVTNLVVSLVDVTEQVRARQRVEEAERKRAELAETLNREIAHRVKNNLSMMAGLLELQIAEQPDAETSAVLRNTVGRLLAFADVHEQMQVAGKGNVDLLSAIESMASANREAFAQKRVIVSVEGEPTLLPPKAATSLAVVANELITNAIKHGAPGADAEMRVDIGVYRAGGNLRLSVWNSGNPIPAGFDASRQRSMGLRLVWGLAAHQYGGTFSLRPHEGGTMAEVVVEEERLR
jgi:PAS domain S-box-containing protein